MSSHVGNKYHFIHGMSGTAIYSVWRGIMQRCYNPSNRAYKWYGARGIRVFPSWKKFPGFYKGVMAEIGERPSLKHGIDRINNDGDYAPGNIQWATQKEQRRNTRSSTRVTVGVTCLSVTEWSEKNGLKTSTIFERLRRGWNPQRAVTAPPMLNPRWHEEARK